MISEFAPIASSPRIITRPAVPIFQALRELKLTSGEASVRP
ncbi:Uncharacterised protein [Mycobacteroides abscessus subsp. abscessus]|nr:Uncharacterised protein [Mycobacteroides abscessus subsp. abscessus]